MKLDLNKLDSPLGAIVNGWEPSEALDETDRAEICDLLAEHSVLVFRGNRQPEDTELVDFANGFGELIKGSEWFQDNGDYAEILRVNNITDKDGMPEGTGGSMQLGWHADYSYVPTVGLESFLNAVELPPEPPHTCFCSQYDAFDSLPESMVDMLRPLRAFHSVSDVIYDEDADADKSVDDLNNSVTGQVKADFLKKRAKNLELGIEKPRIPTAGHPVIMRHPRNGREILYISPQITKCIIGMPRDESDDLIAELCAHSTKAENVYSHDWEVGDLVMFDTLGTMHRRDSWNPSQRRVMRQLSTLLVN